MAGGFPEADVRHPPRAGEDARHPVRLQPGARLPADDFNRLGDVWFGGKQALGGYYGDHYKWRLMRSGGMDAFRGKAVLDTTVLDLARRVAVRENGAFTALCPEKRVASVTVELKDGRLLSRRVDYPKGEPENPISDEELRAKFRSLAACGGLSREAAEEVLRQMSHPDFDTRHIADAIWSRHEMS